MFWKRERPTVTFATSCWERDWRRILLDPTYLKDCQISYHGYPFTRRVLIINNVKDLTMVTRAAQEKIEQGVLTDYVIADVSILSRFHLKQEDFSSDWLLYNALAPLMAIYVCQSDYLLYLTGDVFLPKKTKWLHKALSAMEKKDQFKVANLAWNHRYDEAEREAYRKTWNFFVAEEGFSDQYFLVRARDFQHPIYGEIRQDSSHFPRGDVFEKRVFSYMKNHGWKRITYRGGSYVHQNIEDV